MTEPLYLSKSAFAARIGRTPSYITWLKNNERLVMAPNGKFVDVFLTEALIRETADPSKAAVSARHEQGRIDRDVRSQLSPHVETAPLETVESNSISAPRGLPDFQRAKAHREFYLGQLAEAEFHKVQGSLVDKDAVDRAAFTAGRTVRDLFMGMPPQLAPELASMTDPWEIEKYLANAFRRSFKDAERISVADLEHAVNNAR